MELENIKSMDNPALKLTAGQIRNKIIEYCAKNGGYLSSNLSNVEIVVALNKVFNDDDKFFFSGSEIDYANKIIHNEEIDDSSHINALSTALGVCIARDLDHKDYDVISIVDSNNTLTGDNIESLNQIGLEKRKQIIIYNDNASIDKGIGFMDRFISNLRNTKTYNGIKENVKDILKPKKGGEKIIESIHNFKNNIKKNVIDEGVFGEFGIDYIGPVNGHNIPELLRALEVAKLKEYPCVVHCITTKGKGFIFAESNTNEAWDYAPAFNQYSGRYLVEEKDNYKYYSTILSEKLIEKMKEDESVVLVSPMNKNINKLSEIFAKYPQRSIDINLSSENALNFALGLTSQNKVPFVSLSSKSLSNTYSTMISQIDKSNQKIIIAINTYDYKDLLLLKELKNATISTIDSYDTLINSFNEAFNQDKPYIIAYPNDLVQTDLELKNNEFKLGKWKIVANNDMNNIVIIANSFEVNNINSILNSNYLKYKLVASSFLNPIDKDELDNIFKKAKKIYLYDDILKDKMLEYFNQDLYCPNIRIVENKQVKALFDLIAKEN